MQQTLLEYVPEDATLITIGTGMKMEVSDPWHLWPYQFKKYTLGWVTWIPFNKPVGHSYRALVQDSMYVFTDRNYENEKSTLQYVRRDLEERYGLPTEVVWIVRNGCYAIVQLKVKG